MNRPLLVMLLLFAASGLEAAVINSSDLGWSAEEDVSSRLAVLIADGTLAAGDELHLEQVFRLGGSYTLPDDVTISAVAGAGFDIIDVTPDHSKTTFHLGHRNTLSNLTIRYLDTPEPSPDAGTNPQHGIHFYRHVGIQTDDKNGVRIEYCRFHGSISHHLRCNAGDDLEVVGCHFIGGYWCVYLTGNVSNPLFRECLWERCQGDGIKTGRGDGGTKRPLVERCVFQDCGRDGIDTTGGWKDGIVRDSIMRRLFSGLDIKSYFENSSHLNADCRNENIRIENTTFTDMANAVVLSTIDRGLAYNSGVYFLDATSAQTYAPNNIDIVDCTLERSGSSGVRLVLSKGSHTIRYQNIKRLGDSISLVKLTHVYNTFGGDTLSEEVSDALNHTISGTTVDTGPAPAPGASDSPWQHGPRNLSSIGRRITLQVIVDGNPISTTVQLTQGGSQSDETSATVHSFSNLDALRGATLSLVDEAQGDS